LGAIRPERHIGAAAITPEANTKFMNIYLAEISTRVRSGVIAVVIGDDVRWRAEGDVLKMADNIVLMPLPPGHLWNSYDEIVRACAEVWNWLVADPDRIQSVVNKPWDRSMPKQIGTTR
jgi:hypothetical protein